MLRTLDIFETHVLPISRASWLSEGVEKLENKRSNVQPNGGM